MRRFFSRFCTPIFLEVRLKLNILINLESEHPDLKHSSVDNTYGVSNVIEPLGSVLLSFNHNTDMI